MRLLWGGCALGLISLLLPTGAARGHGTVVSPQSRVHRVYESNPEIPSFELAENAIATDGTQSYYTWMELSRNIAAAVNASLPAGLDNWPAAAASIPIRPNTRGPTRDSTR
jgi:predicted carbohydrate-binding protein with CBM5 and CBM33 domain